MRSPAVQWAFAAPKARPACGGFQTEAPSGRRPKAGGVLTATQIPVKLLLLHLSMINLNMYIKLSMVDM
jgi:hypothetical protein